MKPSLLAIEKKIGQTDFNDEFATSESVPHDYWNLVYWIMLVHGVGVLMPWNMFITAQDVNKHKKMYKEI